MRNTIEVGPCQQDAVLKGADAVAVGFYSDDPLSGSISVVNQATNDSIAKLLGIGELRGNSLELTPLLGHSGIAAKQVLLVGLGERESFRRVDAFQAAAAAAKSLAAHERNEVAFYWPEDWQPEYHEHAIAGAIVGCQGQDIYRAERQLHPFAKISWAAANAEVLEQGRILGESINDTRRLVNEPPNEIYPESFAKFSAEIAESSGMEIEIWDEKKLQAEQCGALLAVARGSFHAPRVVILRYKGGPDGSPTLGLVGKGVTFDSGGLSLKPSDGMKTMKCDMAGAATVVGAMQAIARLKLPVNAIGLCGLVENMPDANSYRLGDVLTARNGRTIEVLNTDAEGRLVLADVLTIARDQGADKLIDLATLTGACVVALGNDVNGLMTNDQAWCDNLTRAADTAGEFVWQLPMFDHFGDQIKSDIADIKNIGDGRWGGAITAAKLLEEFVADTPWIHVDIAGPSFLERPKPWLDAGGSGTMVRTLVELARQGF